MNLARSRPLTLCVSFLCALVLAGCIIVPVRTKTVVENPSGLKDKLPSEALVPGKTTRQQVEAQYKGFEIDSGVPEFFWGRFRKSSWAVFFAVGGPGAATGGGGRAWGVHNMLVTFNNDGTVKDVFALPDKELPDRFLAMQKEQILPPLDLSKPIPVGGMARVQPAIPVDLQLSSAGVVVIREKPTFIKRPDQKREVVTFPIEKVATVKLGELGGEDASEIPVTLGFTEKTIFGKSVKFSAEPRVALTLVRWFGQVKGAQK